MTKKLLAAASIAAVLCACAAGCGKKAEREAQPQTPVGVNLVKNPGFEERVNGMPKDWELKVFAGEGKRENRYGISIDQKKSGNFSAYLRGMYDVDRWMVLTQRFPVPGGYQIWFSAEMKSNGLKRNRGQEQRANIYVRFYDKDGKRVNDRYYADSYTRFLLGSLDWRRSGKRVDVPKEARFVELGLINQMTGYIYFDDVELVVEPPVPWRKVETKYADFYYFDEKPLTSEEIDRESDFLAKVVKTYDLKVEEKISYYYYPSEEKFKEILGFGSGRTHSRIRKNELHTTRPYDDHEVIHMLMEDLGTPPFGILEGSVFYLLGSWEGGRDIHMMTKQLLTEQRLPGLYQIVPQKAMDDIGFSITVCGWASFSMWLIDRQGLDKFMKLYRETDGIQDVGPFSAHFKDVYGRDFQEMDREWRLWVMRYQPKA